MFTRQGYELLGYSKNKSATSADYVDGTKYTFTDDNTPLYAIWKEANWTISYNMNGHGSVPSGARTVYSSANLPYYPPNPTNPDGWVFDYWTPFGIEIGDTGNQTFSATWHEASSECPGYLTAFLLDVSGSMFIREGKYNFADFGKAISTIVLMQRDYLCRDNAYAKVMIYSGTEVDNIKSTTTIQELDVTHSTYPGDKEFWERVQPYVFGQAGRGGDENMLSCLYYVINDVFEKFILTDDFTIGSSNLKGISFVVLSDETVIGKNSLGGYSTVKSQCQWISDWQDNVPTIMKLPSESSEVNSTEKKQAAAELITNVFKYISHYYGVNITVGLSELVSGLTSAETKHLMQTKKIPYVNAICRDANGNELHPEGTTDKVDRITLTPSFKWESTKSAASKWTPTSVTIVDDVADEYPSTWTVPYGISQPYDTMTKVTFYNANFVSTKIIQPSDIYVAYDLATNFV